MITSYAIMHSSRVIALTISCCFVLSTAGAIASGTEDSTSPNASVEAHYAALKSLDMDKLKRLHRDMSWANQSEISRLNSIRLGYKIVEVKPMHGGNYRPGDVYVKVEETFKDRPGATIMHYQLRRSGSRWIIVNFNADEGPPERPRDVVRPQTKQK